MYWGQHFYSCCSFWNCSQQLISTSYILSGIASEQESTIRESFLAGSHILLTALILVIALGAVHLWWNALSQNLGIYQIGADASFLWAGLSWQIQSWMDFCAVEMKKLTNSFCNCLFYSLSCYFMEDNYAAVKLVCVYVCVCVCVNLWINIWISYMCIYTQIKTVPIIVTWQLFLM